MQNIRKNFFELMLVSIFGIVAQFALLKILSGASDHQYLATWAIFEVSAAFSLSVSLFGGEYSLVNSIHSIAESREKAIELFAYLFLFLLLFFFVCTPFLIIYFHHFEPLVESDFYNVVAYSALSSIIFIFAIYFRAMGSFILSALSERVVLIAILAISYSSLLFSTNIDLGSIAFISGVIGLLIVSAMFICVNRFNNFRGFVKAGFLPLRVRNLICDKSSKKITLTNIIIFIYERGDQILIGILLGPAVLAGYFLCYKLSYFVRFFSKALNTVCFVYISKIINSPTGPGDGEASLRLLRDNLSVNAVVAAIFVVIIMVETESILNFFALEKDEYKYILRMLGVCLFLSIPNQVIFSFINANSGGGYYLNNAIVTTLAQLLLVSIFVPALGLLGVVISRASAVIIGNIIASKALREMGYIFSFGKIYRGCQFIVLSLMLLQLYYEY